MIDLIKENLWMQFGGCVDMLEQSIRLWPEDSSKMGKKFFYIAYHNLIFLDYYLNIPSRDISSPLPFTITEAGVRPEGAVDDLVPDRIYSKKELLDYVQSCREKCRKLIAGLTEERLKERWVDESGTRNYSIFELLIYNMRHVQHHTGQLYLLLRQGIQDAPKWVRRTNDNLFTD